VSRFTDQIISNNNTIILESAIYKDKTSLFLVNFANFLLFSKEIFAANCQAKSIPDFE